MSLDTTKPPLLGCPFCGAQPHWSLSRVQHDQLHGEPFQRRIISCPKRHAQVNGVNNADAVREWNTRATLNAIKKTE